MSEIVFGDFAADMRDPLQFGYADFFPSDDVEMLSISAAWMVFRDPTTDSTYALGGTIDDSSFEAFMNSMINSIEAHAGLSGQPLLYTWSGLAFALSSVFVDTEQEERDFIVSLFDASDVISGGTRNDILGGFGGNDSIFGGQGIDTAFFSGPRSHYQVSLLGAAATVTDLVGGEGVDSLSGIERLLLDWNGPSPTWWAIDIAPIGQVTPGDPEWGVGGNGGKAYRLYQAAFDRTPDKAGVGYWIAQVDAGASLFDIATGFIGSAEFKSLYGDNPTNQQYTQALYQNVLHRDPDQAGYDYWNAVLNGDPLLGQTTRQQMLVDFSESAENKANVIEAIGQGFEYELWVVT